MHYKFRDTAWVPHNCYVISCCMLISALLIYIALNNHTFVSCSFEYRLSYRTGCVESAGWADPVTVLNGWSGWSIRLHILGADQLHIIKLAPSFASVEPLRVTCWLRSWLEMLDGWRNCAFHCALFHQSPATVQGPWPIVHSAVGFC